MINMAAAAANSWMLSEFEAKNLQSLQELKQKYKVQVKEFPAEVISELRRLTDIVLEEEATKDPAFRQILQAYSSFRDSNTAWNDISEAAYAKALKL